MKTSEANELRCIAHEIMGRLYKAGEAGQIRILWLWCNASLEALDQKGHREVIERAYSQLKDVRTPPPGFE